MAIGAEAVFYDLVDVSGYELYSELHYGSDGLPWGEAELEAGSSYDTWYERVEWDGSAGDGFDSGWRPIELIVHVGSDGSTLQWNVAGTQLAYAGAAFNTIEQIQICSGVTTQAALAWDSLQVKFYSNGMQTDSWMSQSGPTVDQTGDANAGELEKILTITPMTGTNVDEVRITANVRLSAPEGALLDFRSIFGRVAIDAA
ncbi:MAG TPA: hypothetical protein VHP11_08490 [Tepidisphaeraceae bacterium]|nr:hypothetical protein [Tepidisphaeraceae bacterium]